MKKAVVKKLMLNRTTVRELAPEALAQAAGGATLACSATIGTSCNPTVVGCFTRGNCITMPSHCVTNCPQ